MPVFIMFLHALLLLLSRPGARVHADDFPALRTHGVTVAVPFPRGELSCSAEVVAGVAVSTCQFSH